MDPITWGTVAKWGIPIALSLFGATRGGSGQAQAVSKEQEDLLKLYGEIMRNRAQLTGPNRDAQGNLSGPMVDALMMAMNNAQRASSQTPRSVVNAAPFNPFGEARPPQRFSASAQPDMTALLSMLLGGGGGGGSGGGPVAPDPASRPNARQVGGATDRTPNSTPAPHLRRGWR